jgi:hypothetical protein
MFRPHAALVAENDYNTMKLADHCFNGRALGAAPEPTSALETGRAFD